MVVYCILTGLLVYYIALWLWYHYTDSRTSPGKTDDALLPRNEVSGYTLIGESRYKGGLIGTAQDKSGQCSVICSLSEYSAGIRSFSGVQAH